jgi:hypothetical protein
MKRISFLSIVCMMLLSACTRNTQHFNLVLLANYDPALQAGEKLPAHLQDILGVYAPDSCAKNILYVPDITIKRTDAHPEITDQLKPSAGFLGEILHGLGLMSNEAYKENIRQSLADMITPKILTDRLSGSMNMVVPNGSIVLDKRTNDHFAGFKNDIACKMWKKERTGDVVLYFPDTSEPNQSDPNSNNALLLSIFKKLIDPSKKPLERADQVEGLIKGLFAEEANIEAFGTDGHRAGQFSPPEFCRMIISDIALTDIEIIDIKSDDKGKIWSVKVLEHRRVLQPGELR